MRKTAFAIVCLLLWIIFTSAGSALATGFADVVVKPSPSPEPTAAPVINNDFTIDVMLGYEGLLIMNRWMPTFVTVTNNGADFDGTLGVNVFQTEISYDRYDIPLVLAGGATKTLLLPIKPFIRQDMYAFELVADKKIIAEMRVKPARLIAPESVSIGILSDDTSALTYFAQRANGLDTLRGESWFTIPLDADTFPQTDDLMNSITMLVVDGFDIRTLTQTQRDVFDAWLQKGGVVFVSGGAKAAAGYPYFAAWTGLEAGKIAEAEDITPALASYITTSAKPLEKPIWINPIPRERAIVATEQDGLIAMTKVGEGIIYSAAFDIGGKPYTEWPSAASLWPRVLRTSAPTFYVKLLEKQDQYRFNSYSYRINELINSLKVPNTDSGIPVIVILLLYFFVCGFGGYWVLKRIDKAEWLWVLTPASAIVFGLVILLLSGRASTNQPVALSTSKVKVAGNASLVTTYIGIATPYSGELLVETGQGELPTVIKEDDYYSEYDTSKSLFRPLEMLQRYRYGERPAIGFTSTEVWKPRVISISANTPDQGAMEGSLWVEADGVHGEFTNKADALLTDCMVITNFGYDIIGDLLPGQRAEIHLARPQKPIQFSASDFTYEPGIMYSLMDADLTSPDTRRITHNMIYELINAILYDQKTGDYRGPAQRIQNTMINLFEDEFSFYQNASDSFFFGFSDSMGQVAVTLNGERVARTAHTAIVGYKIPFHPIGPTGEVFFPQGHIPAEVIVDMGEDEKPRLPTRADGDGNSDNQYYSKDTYIRYGAPVALRFVLPDYASYTVEQLSFGSAYYDSIPNLFFYNHKTQKWDKQKSLSLTFKGDECLPYIDEEGILYVRYTPTDSTGRYDSMQAPLISLKGKVK